MDFCKFLDIPPSILKVRVSKSSPPKKILLKILKEKRFCEKKNLAGLIMKNRLGITYEFQKTLNKNISFGEKLI